MVGLAYDFLANPLGAVRLAFEKAVASSPPDADPAAAFRGNDWGAVDLFRDFLFEQGGLSQVPGQNSWAMEPSPSPGVRNMSSSTSQHGVKRGRNTEDDMDLNVILYVFVPYPP
ncbi:hypothetical protein GW17_00056848 [Ensete ventricosum]|uniref:Uncharacterized protein n=1 Tax=Ensete ventricosum TaxID=4639 RepID=A0A444C760_ENSVE|nr:hypothetical protein B296_00005937 [Ensete ventricosum]RWV81712.1 hypothetical protein GW17_00056848 [Ensete ventricosum]